MNVLKAIYTEKSQNFSRIMQFTNLSSTEAGVTQNKSPAMSTGSSQVGAVLSPPC